ncbi:hypothetical protein [Spongiimicrobium salis]|uniref:hypothetical protein n=1 Tax=Spongiimicrobium salis TaxID=1667022 RepID=UPI00374DF361
MSKENNKTRLYAYGLTVLLSLIVLLDFALPGKVFTEDVLDIKKTRQNYYNAAGNYHYSYKVVTAEHQFLVSEDFAKLAQDEKIAYSVSWLFKEVNRHRLPANGVSSIYSLRMASGLILPLLVILMIAIAYGYKKRMSRLIFVLQVISVLNLILLLQ